MGEDARERAFEPYFTAKAKRSAGFGLATLWSLVAGLGGTVEVESEPAKGGTVRVSFPGAAGGDSAP